MIEARLAMRRLSFFVPLASVVLAGRPALGFDTGKVGQEPVHVDVTEAATVLYNVDNRNSEAADVAHRLDDDWGVFYNRLNAQASYRGFQAGLRLDSAWFYASRDPVAVSLDLLRERHGGRLPDTYTQDDAAFFVQKTTEASRELATRYTSWLYPAKYYVSYVDRNAEVNVGDFYAQLGRGLVLSVRKLDELASDTTIRGARVTGRLRADAVRFRATLLGGAMNPLRFDEASGRYLGVTSAVTPGLVGIAEGGMPRAQASPFDDHAEPTYSPDRVAGAQLEAGTRDLLFSVQGSLLTRTEQASGQVALSPGAVRSARSIRTASAALTLPDISGHGSLYVEAALQGLDYPAAIAANSTELPDTGHAVYASATVTAKPVTLTMEGKHYRRFFPLLANVDLARAPEFAAAQYSAPPTTEAIWVDTEYEGFNTCVTGGKLRADVELGPRVTVFTWAGRYFTWAESVANEQCSTARENRNGVWDLATGLEAASAERSSRASLTFGARADDSDRLLPDPNAGQTHVFYREAYVRYDAIARLFGPFGLKLQGYARRRHQTQGGILAPWTELTNTVAVDWNSRLVVGAGFDYVGNPQFPPTYFNGLVSYALDSSSSVSLFAGQRRGGLRCVSGVCRIFPPFEGVRLDATFRF